MTYDRDNPPSFSAGEGWKSERYPNGGVKTGPAWRAMWQQLADAANAGDDWLSGEDLDRVGVEASGCAPFTAKLLLHRAEIAGVLEKRLISGKGADAGHVRKRVHYRIMKAEGQAA